jgi:putative endonuclease
MVRRRASAVSNHVARQVASSFETRRDAAPQDEELPKNGRPKVTEGAFLYILRCADGGFYIGTTRTSLEIRVAQHNAGLFGGYTATRRPVTLVFSQWFERVIDAIENERKLKKWSRAKKEAFIHGDFAELRQLSARRLPHHVDRRSTKVSSE